MYYCANRYAIQKAKAIKIQSMLRMHNQKSHYKNMQESAIKYNALYAIVKQMYVDTSSLKA